MASWIKIVGQVLRQAEGSSINLKLTQGALRRMAGTKTPARALVDTVGRKHPGFTTNISGIVENGAINGSIRLTGQNGQIFGELAGRADASLLAGLKEAMVVKKTRIPVLKPAEFEKKMVALDEVLKDAKSLKPEALNKLHYMG